MSSVEQPGAPEDVPGSELNDAPLVKPVRPGPNIWTAGLWWFMLLAAQFLFGFGAAILIVIVAVVRLGPEGFRASMQKGGSGALLNMPGAMLILFLTATGCTLLVGAAIVALQFRKDALRLMALRGMSPLHGMLVLLMVLPTLLVAGNISTLSSRVLPDFGSNDQMYANLAAEAWPLVLLLGCLLPAAGEELFFRGYLSRGLVARHGVVFGTFLTALLFGLLHVNPPQVVGTAILAIGFQVAYLSTKSLWAPVLFHALNNAISFLLMRLALNAKNSGTPILNEQEPLPPLLFATAVVAALAVGWLLYETRIRWVMPSGEFWSPGYITAETPPTALGAVPKRWSPRLAAVATAAVAYAIFVAVLLWEIWKVLKSN